ncbi:putative magnesium transporter YhiD [Porphyridium purpureum]|uniref:Putative magnesium transporter YhiD n=1 Tax=Porphyridium purpureum TaxID=35688 RepID=A0A5J4Z435_PORPP|nr:putative magnesium transporter YhiD [Porphyridium purpureum]|eukprot:POR8264..scf295_1
MKRFGIWAAAAQTAASAYKNAYFPSDEYPRLNAILYTAMLVAVLVVSLSSLLAPLLVRDCVKTLPEKSSWSNPLYPGDACFFERRNVLLGQSLLEADLMRRMVASVLLAVPIGYERRSPDRSAGIKLMILVSIGSCSFTISSIYSFESSTSGYDTARVAAAIVSGVGFLASAMIYKGGDQASHAVYGLTTAASVWVAAAVGISSGGELYFAGMYTTVLVVIILRFMPRAVEHAHADESEAQKVVESTEELGQEEEKESPRNQRSQEATVNISYRQPRAEPAALGQFPLPSEHAASEPALSSLPTQQLTQAEIDQDLDDFLELQKYTPHTTAVSPRSSRATNAGSAQSSVVNVATGSSISNPKIEKRQPSIAFR